MVEQSTILLQRGETIIKNPKNLSSRTSNALWDIYKKDADFLLSTFLNFQTKLRWCERAIWSWSAMMVIIPGTADRLLSLERMIRWLWLWSDYHEDDQMIIGMIIIDDRDSRDDPQWPGLSWARSQSQFWIWFFCAADRYICCGFLLYISTMYIHWRRISEHDAGRLWWWWWWWRWWQKGRNSCFGFLSIRLQQVSLAQQGIFFQPIHKIISHLNWCVIVFDIFSVFQ